MKILVSGFEPFGGRERNTSWELIRPLPKKLAGHSLSVVRLPVAYGKAWPVLEKAVGEFRPDAVISLGESPRREFALERVAINLRDCERADNSQRVAVNEPILAGAPAAYFSTLPIEGMLEALKKAEIPAQSSLSAGAYLCNEVFFLLMHHAAASDLKTAGFVHVPRDGAFPKSPVEVLISSL